MADQIKNCPYCGKRYTGNGFHGYCGVKCAKEAEGDEWVAKMKKKDAKLAKLFFIGIALIVIFVALTQLGILK